MDALEKHPRIVLGVAALFAITGLAAVFFGFSGPANETAGPAYDDVFKTPEQIEAEMAMKRKTLETLATLSSTTREISEEEKLRVLESLRTQ